MSQEIALQEERIGFYICHCGINIAFKVRCAEVAEYIGTLPGVVISRDYLFMCSDPGQEIIEKDIKEFDLTRVVVASCSPRMHEHTFRAACARAGLNPFRAFHHVCVREHVSWVTLDEDEATEKAKLLSKAGINRVRYQSDLFPKTFPVNPNTLVVGGGIAGMQASLDIASAGYTVYLVERQATIGGHMLQYDKTFPTMDCAACIGTPKMVSVGQHPNINILSYSEVEDVSGFVGNFEVKVKKRARYVDIKKCTGCGDCAAVVITDENPLREVDGELWVDRIRIDEAKCIHCGECVMACVKENPERQGVTNVLKQRFKAVENGVEIEQPTLLQRILLMTPEERARFWENQFKKCIKCYGCVDICPVYVCPPDGLELPQWVKGGEIPPSYPLFHLLRAYHVWDTCVGCGECERTCPANIPLKTIQDLVRYLPPEEVFALIPGLVEDAQNKVLAHVESRKERAGRTADAM